MTHEAVFQVEKVIPSLIGGTITEALKVDDEGRKVKNHEPTTAT